MSFGFIVPKDFKNIWLSDTDECYSRNASYALN